VVEAAIRAMGTLAEKPANLGILASFGSWLGWPDWMREGTSLEGGEGPLPPELRVADDLIVTANLLDHVEMNYLIEALIRVGQPSLSGLGRLTLTQGPTLADSIALSQTALRFGSPCFSSSLSVDGELAQVDLVSHWPLGDLCHFAGLCWILFVYQSILIFQPRGPGQMRIELTLAPNDAPPRLPAMLACPVSLGAQVNRLAFPGPWLGARNPAHDPLTWALTKARAEARLKAWGETEKTAKIRALIARLLDQEEGPPRLKQAALASGMSTRTIVRTLAESGTSFHRLVEEERKVRALQLVGNPALSIGTIPEKLGFPDASSFGRKFRLWFGDSPASFRRTMGSGR
jgi:AraC-like DNA-binding protein